MIKRSDWSGLYKERWQNEIVPEAMSHPAKFSRALIRKIYAHAIEEGWLQPGDMIVDPFAGVALGGLEAMINGMEWVGMELEPRFIELGRKNIELWEKKYRNNFPRFGHATVVQGDSRKLIENLNVSGEPRVEISVSSPPFTGTSSDGGWQMLGKYAEEGRLTVEQVGGDPTKSYPSWDKERDTSYGHSDGQLADMPSDGFDVALSSPPFLQTSGGTNVTATEGVLADERLIKRHAAGNAAAEGYGKDENNLGNMQGSDDGFGLAVSSPPYADIPQTGGTKGLIEHGTGLTRGERFFTEYGESEGQLGRMEADNAGFETAISSPPYIDTPIRDARHLHYDDRRKDASIELYKTNPGVVGYGTTEGNISTMKDNGIEAAISSPPYSEARIGQESGQEQCGHNDAYGDTEGQLGGMKAQSFDEATATISSPPFEAVTSDHPSEKIIASGLKMGASSMGNGYGETYGQLGLDSGNDFWIAARQIIDQVYTVLRPGGHAIWVVKKFVKNKRLVHFDRMWAKVCVAAGFEVVHWHRAWVVELKGSQYHMDGYLIENKTERKSFFRRLAEKKGSPRIDWETVICMRKPE